MTIRVTVSHDQPGYDKDIIVNYLQDNRLDVNMAPIIIKPGEERIFYIYDKRSIQVSEYGGS